MLIKIISKIAKLQAILLFDNLGIAPHLSNYRIINLPDRNNMKNNCVINYVNQNYFKNRKTSGNFIIR